MVDGIKCPKCGSEKVAGVLYGLPAYDEELQKRLDAGDIVLNGCHIGVGAPLYPYECQTCGSRFDDDGAGHPSAKVFFAEEDYARIENLSLFWGRDDDDSAYEPFTDDENLAFICAELARELLDGNPNGFVRELDLQYADAYRYYSDPTFARVVILGLEYGVACGDGACANWLGAMYYMGDVVDQDYGKAKELYELAEAEGIEQAMINLGYIYEYGRTGEPDYVKAYMQYAKAAAICNAPEALYKLGDMYCRGNVAPRDVHTAYTLYQKSFEQAYVLEIRAQAAMRIADLVSDRANIEWSIPYDPIRALELYQLAELGLRRDIAHGQKYYAKRLQEALEGQERMREVLSVSGARL